MKVFPDPRDISRSNPIGRFLVRMLTRRPKLLELSWWHVGTVVLVLGFAGAVAMKMLFPAAPAEARVVATVNGEPITAAELAAETNGGDTIDAATQRGVIDGIVNRKLLAAAARKAGLDRQPQLAMAGARAIETQLATMLAQQLAGEERIDDDAARRYIASHPTRFGARQFLVIDGAMLESSVATGRMLEKAFTIDDAAAILKRANLPFARSRRVIDTATLPDALAAQIAGTPDGRLFAVPMGDSALVGAVVARGKLIAPDALHIELAREELAAERRDAKVRAALAKMRRQAKISYAG